MAKRKRVTPEEREAIVAAFQTGKSCNEIAKEFGRSSDTISRIAKDAGHSFGQPNASRARAVKALYDDERRANLRMMHVEAVERMFGQLFAPAKLMKIGGKDNVYTEKDIPEPTFQDKRDLTNAIANLMRIVNQMDRNEAERHATGTFDEWFKEIDRNADEYADRPEEQAGV